MNSHFISIARLCVLLTVVAVSGCQPKSPQKGSIEPQVVSVSRPILDKVSDYTDFTGRTDAVEFVEIRARVTGYLDRIAFKDGTEVRKNDVLFQIDPRPFKAEYDQAVAQIKVRQANLENQRAELARAKTLLPQNAISQSDFDKTAASYGEVIASVAAAEENAKSAELNLEYSTIASPIDGRISRTNITVGNLVKADNTLLTTVVSQDPIYVYFDVDERTMLLITRMQLAAKENLLQTKKVPIRMALADEQGFPHAGFVDFADNVVDPSTGTITARGVFPNPPNPSGFRLLRPGMFVRVRLPFGEPRQSVLVAERALGTDQGKKYLLVVDEKRCVQYRRVNVGPPQDNGLRVILAGLEPGELVIVSGLQLVRPKMEVRTEEVPMPVSPAADTDGPEPGGNTASPTAQHNGL